MLLPLKTLYSTSLSVRVKGMKSISSMRIPTSSMLASGSDMRPNVTCSLKSDCMLEFVQLMSRLMLVKGDIDRMGMIQILMHDGFYIRKLLGVINEG